MNIESTYVGLGIDVCYASVIDPKRLIGIELLQVRFTIYVFANLTYIFSQVVLDIYAMALISLNALSVPRMAQRPLSEILQRDGLMLITVCRSDALEAPPLTERML